MIHQIAKSCIRPLFANPVTYITAAAKMSFTKSYRIQLAATYVPMCIRTITLENLPKMPFWEFLYYVYTPSYYAQLCYITVVNI